MNIYDENITIESFNKGDVVSITQKENGKDVTYYGTVTELFKSPLNSGEIRITGKNLKYGFKDIGILWIKKVEFHENMLNS